MTKWARSIIDAIIFAIIVFGAAAGVVAITIIVMGWLFP